MRRSATVRVGSALALPVLLLSGGPVAALELPTPAGQRDLDTQLLTEVGARPDRVLTSVVPGPVVNDEVVLVGLGPDGAPRTVRVEQRLTLTGTGDYQVRERGPARAAEPLGDEPPPVTKFGAVVWQGFSPGRRELAARLTLDPALEAARLPLSVQVRPQGTQVGPGGRLTGPGALVLRLENTTSQPTRLPTAEDADAAAVAVALDLARQSARTPGPRLPAAAGAGPGALPARVPSSGDAAAEGQVGVPLHVDGTVRLAGATVTGPGVTPGPDGATLTGTLSPGQAVELGVTAAQAGTLDLDLTVTPVLDARLLEPPDGADSWKSWAAVEPDRQQRRQALELLVQTAAIGARAASYSPYLGADLPGTGSTRFAYSFAPVQTQAPSARPLEPRRGPIGAAVAAVLLLALAGTLLWSRS